MFCIFYLPGYHPYSSELQGFKAIGSLASGKASAPLSGQLLEGRQVYCTLRCYNKAGLSAQRSSSGVTVVNMAPDASRGVMEILTSSATHYPLTSHYQSNPHQLSLAWRGFTDTFGIAFYEVR